MANALPDPLKDRVVNEIDPPPCRPLDEALLYPDGSSVPDWRLLKSHLFREGKLKHETCMDLINKVKDIVGTEPNLLRLKDPITVVGDIHGQFFDMLKVLDVGGDPDKTQYLFLGDYVDRGSFSIEVMLLIYALKLNHPEKIWLLRGNHECRQMTAFFNFRDECEYKYDSSLYFAFMESFDTLPLAAVVNGKFLAVHGGLSPDLRILTQIGGINRFQEPPRAGLFCDLLWADPVDEEREEQGGTTVNTSDTFFPNDVRGCSFFFGYEAASSFLDRNGLLSVIRAHEAQLEGYKMHQKNVKTGFPTVITIFSAPNYCDCYNNKGAVLKFENNTLNIQQFNFSPHPYHLPNFMDVFTWSIPFVSEKVTEMLYAILQPSVTDDEDDDDDVELPQEILNIMHRSLSMTEAEDTTVGVTAASAAQARDPRSSTLKKERAEAMRRKVQSIGRLMGVFRKLRERNEEFVQLGGATPGHRIPASALLHHEDGGQTQNFNFESARRLDSINERRPAGQSS